MDIIVVITILEDVSLTRLPPSNVGHHQPQLGFMMSFGAQKPTAKMSVFANDNPWVEPCCSLSLSKPGNHSG